MYGISVALSCNYNSNIDIGRLLRDVIGTHALDWVFNLEIG